MKSLLDWHADDFGVSMHASKDIIECCNVQTLDSISIIPNMSCFEDSLTLLSEAANKWNGLPRISIHINLMEGHCMAPINKIKDLVDNMGYFKISWGKLFLISFNPFLFKRYKQELKIEIRTQLSIMRNNIYHENKMRIDSHQHTHMLPVVFSALKEVILEEDYKVEFIRVSKEPILPYLKHVELYRTYSLINWIKNIVLNICSIPITKWLKQHGIEYGFLWGLVMGCEMDEKRVAILFTEFMAYAERKKKCLEILFHPGSSLPSEMTKEYVKQGFIEDHLSTNRKIEYNTLLKKENITNK